MATPIRPLIPLGRPGFSLMSVQVSPPSVDLYRPLSGPPLCMFQGLRRASNMAAKRMRGLLGSMEMSTAPALSLLKRTRSQVLPPSLVL